MRAVAVCLGRVRRFAWQLCFFQPSDRCYGVLADRIGLFFQVAYLMLGVYSAPGMSLRFSAHFNGTGLRLVAGIGCFVVLMAWTWAIAAIYRAIVTHLCQVTADRLRDRRQRERGLR